MDAAAGVTGAGIAGALLVVDISFGGRFVVPVLLKSPFNSTQKDVLATAQITTICCLFFVHL